METLDAFGLQCPKPLMMAKARLDEGAEEIAVKVDNETAVKNLSRLAERTGRTYMVDAIDGGWIVSFGKVQEGAASVAQSDTVPTSS